jgi:hypothetical protein
VGLPWAAFAGNFAARNMLGEADEDYKKYYRYFSNRHHFAFPSGLVKIIGKPLVFSLSNSGRSSIRLITTASTMKWRVLTWGTAFAPDQPVSTIHFDVSKPSLDGVSAKSRLSLQRLKLERLHVSLDRVFRWASLSGRVAL